MFPDTLEPLKKIKCIFAVIRSYWKHLAYLKNSLEEEPTRNFSIE